MLIRELSHKAHQAVGPILGAILLVYFGYHAVQGDTELVAWWQHQHELDRVSAELASLSVTRSDWERRVELLGPDSLDPDILEERSYLMLSLVHPSDLVIPYPID